MPEGAAGKRARLSGPIQFFRKLLVFWHLDESDAVKLLGFDLAETEYVHEVLRGRRQLVGRDPRDRLAHFFHIRKTLRSLFRDLDVENEWLRERHSF